MGYKEQINRSVEFNYLQLNFVFKILVNLNQGNRRKLKKKKNCNILICF